jgi:Ca-activated chloride channel family protein
MKSLRVLTVLAGLTLVAGPGRTSIDLHAQEHRPTFTTGVTLVPITAVVRDSRSRIVRNLERHEFQVLENSKPRPIVEFRATDQGPVSLALVFDTSGSMRGRKLDRAREAVARLLERLDPVSDEAALFTFDNTLRAETPFTGDFIAIRQVLQDAPTWGTTSLYDAIAGSAENVGRRQSQRRAVVVISDGLDTSSDRTLHDVYTIASAIDVPVYVLAVELPGYELGESARASAGLADLAFETGGDLGFTVTPDTLEQTLGEMMIDLRQQYFLAIEADSAEGWHRLDVTTRRKNLKVRARGGYFVDKARQTTETDQAELALEGGLQAR